VKDNAGVKGLSVGRSTREQGEKGKRGGGKRSSRERREGGREGGKTTTVASRVNPEGKRRNAKIGALAHNRWRGRRLS